MDRPDEGLLDVVEGRGQPLAAVAPRGRGSVLQTRPEPGAHLRGGLAGEGHGGERARRAAPLGEERHHAADETGRLARARGGLDEQRRLQIGLDPETLGVIGRRGAGHLATGQGEAPRIP